MQGVYLSPVAFLGARVTHFCHFKKLEPTEAFALGLCDLRRSVRQLKVRLPGDQRAGRWLTCWSPRDSVRAWPGMSPPCAVSSPSSGICLQGALGACHGVLCRKGV